MIISKSWTEDEVAAVHNFNPHMIYTMRKVPLQQLLLKTPRPYALWNGLKYEIRSKHIGAGVCMRCRLIGWTDKGVRKKSGEIFPQTLDNGH